MTTKGPMKTKGMLLIQFHSRAERPEKEFE
jgi:hypothetical protein